MVPIVLDLWVNDNFAWKCFLFEKKRFLNRLNSYTNTNIYNSGLKPSKLKNYHIFSIQQTSAFSWYTPSGLVWYRYFFRYQIFPRLFSSTKFDRYRFQDFFPVQNFFRYRFRYHKKKWKISGSCTGTHYKSSKFKNFGDKNQLRYQIFPIPVPRLFLVPNLSDTGSDTTRKNEKFLVPVPIRYQYPL